MGGEGGPVALVSVLPNASMPRASPVGLVSRYQTLQGRMQGGGLVPAAPDASKSGRGGGPAVLVPAP